MYMCIYIYLETQWCEIIDQLFFVMISAQFLVIKSNSTMSNKKWPVRSKNNQIVQSPWYPLTRWCCKHRCCSLLPIHHFHGRDFREPCVRLVLNLPYLLSRPLTLMHIRSKTLVPHVLESTLRASRDTCPTTDSFASQLHAKGFNTSGALSLSCFRRSFPMWSNACNFGFNP